MESALDAVVTHGSKRLVKVGLSGLVATAIDVVTLIVLVESASVHVTVAAFLGAVAGGVANFLVNKYWAFRDLSPIDLRQIATYALVSLVTAVFVAASVHVFAVLLELPYLLAKGIAAALVFVLWSYPAQARLVFTGAGGPPAHDDDDDADDAEQADRDLFVDRLRRSSLGAR